MFKEKKNYMTYDYMIVGQGLAGSCMALQLLKAGKKILVIDQPHANSSSMVAAGIFNPITGRKMVKTWKADMLFPYLQKFYREVEQECQAQFLNQMNIYRPFLGLEEQNEWMGRSTSEDHQRYIENVHHKPQYQNDLKDEYGGLELRQSGYVDLPIFIHSIRELLKSKNAYLESEFREQHLIVNDAGVSYEKYNSKNIIICNGEGIADSKLFGWLPYSMVKGEVLEISVSKLPKVLYNRGVFILPKKERKCRVGATYELNDRTYDATEKARKALVSKLNGLYQADYKITNQIAGIRPATRDRRPFIGIHPEYQHVAIFNGLGAKGVTLAPYFSKQFVDMLEGNGKLDKEVDITRYKSLYYDSID